MTSAHARDAVLQHFRWEGGHGDIWRVFADGVALAAVIEGLAEPWQDSLISHVVGIEARGLLLGAATAVALGTGFVAIRKGETGPLPGAKVTTVADEDYRRRRHRLRMQAILSPNDRVLLVDDWAERGSQALAAKRLVDMCGAYFAGVSLVVNELPVQVHATIGRVTTIVTADELGPSGEQPSN